MSASSESWPRRHRLSVEDYYRMAEAGVLSPDARVELIEGEIIDMAPIGSRHAFTVDTLAKRLIGAVGERAVVRIQGPVRLGSISEPQPDLLVLRPPGDLYADNHPTASNVILLIEVSDATLRYDLEVKTALYAGYGIAETWIIDLRDGMLHVFARPVDGEYRERSAPAGTTARIPELLIDLDLTGLLSQEHPTGARR